MWGVALTKMVIEQALKGEFRDTVSGDLESVRKLEKELGEVNTTDTNSTARASSSCSLDTNSVGAEEENDNLATSPDDSESDEIVRPTSLVGGESDSTAASGV